MTPRYLQEQPIDLAELIREERLSQGPMGFWGVQTESELPQEDGTIGRRGEWTPLGTPAGMPNRQNASPSGPPPGPPQLQPQQKQTGWKGMLAGAIRGGIAGGATPNIAGGGGTDIFRAAQSGMGAVEQNRITNDQQQFRNRRQQIEDEIAQSTIRQNEAQTRMYDAHAKQYESAATGKGGSDIVTLPPGAAIVDKATGKVIFKNDQGEKKPVVLRPGEVAYDADGKPVMKNDTPEKKATADKPTVTELTNERTTIADQMKITGDARTRYILEGKLPPPVKPEKPEKPDKEPKATPVQFRTVEHTKQASMLRAKQNMQRRLAEASKNSFGGASNLDEGTRAQILQDYNDEMAMAQQAYEAEIVALGGSVAPRGTTPTGPQQPAKPGAAPMSAPAAPKMTPNASGYAQRRNLFGTSRQ